MYYSYVEIEYVAGSFSPARMDLALKLLNLKVSVIQEMNLQKSTYRQDEFTRKYTSFRLSHRKCDSGDNTVGW
jgi:hypothetical protein